MRSPLAACVESVPNTQLTNSDSVLRHAKKCGHRAGRPIPAGIKRGRGRKACDRCALSKLACDTDDPCESCLSRGLECSYDRVDVACAPGSQPAIPLPAVNCQTAERGIDNSIDSDDLQAASPPQITRSHSTLFLLQYTARENKNITDFRNALESCSILPHDPGSPPCGLQDGNGRFLSQEDCNAWDSPLVWNNIFPAGSMIAVLDGESIGISSLEDINRSSLEQRIPDILSLIHLDDHNDLYRHNGSSNAQIRPIFEKLLTISNIYRALEAFFRRMYPYNLAIHRPTFTVDKISPRLFLAMVVAGSIYDSVQDMSSLTYKSFDTLESIIFDNNEFELLTSGHHDCSLDCCSMHLDLLSAAAIVIYLQLGMNDKTKRSRMRMIRVPMLVTAGRNLSLFSTLKLDTHETPGNTFAERWYEWIKTEKRIRMAFSIFQIDSELAIFFRTMPNITLREMTLDFPSAEVVFRAKTWGDWLLSDQTALRPHIHNFSSCFTELVEGADNAMTESLLQKYNLTDLFYVLWGMFLQFISGCLAITPETIELLCLCY
ncbi:c2h2 finger domain protein [Fusarium beomiforme]|uniref:C2h2 finger domain protein n=1 Tax=Fusarium beomiforme TaxID=44412 RepID=A0A9P5A7L5_9HYPO|nr:c2h2 finger domain protein [Fusarium beomiforme]